MSRAFAHPAHGRAPADRVLQCIRWRRVRPHRPPGSSRECNDRGPHRPRSRVRDGPPRRPAGRHRRRAPCRGSQCRAPLRNSRKRTWYRSFRDTRLSRQKPTARHVGHRPRAPAASNLLAAGSPWCSAPARPERRRRRPLFPARSRCIWRTGDHRRRSLRRGSRCSGMLRRGNMLRAGQQRPDARPE